MFGKPKTPKTPKKTVKKVEKDIHLMDNHAATVKDLMTVADGMRVEASRIYISPSGYTKIYYVTALPNVVRFGYLDRFFQVGADIHVTIHADPADSAKAISKRNKMMTQLESEILLENKAGTNKNIAYNQKMYQLLEQEREEIRLGQERLFYVTIIFSVSSPDLDEFNTACERIEREGLQGFVAREAYMEHDLGFRAVAPIGENALKHSIEITSTALANSFPFNNSRFSHEYGVPVGVDFSTGHLNRYDAWSKDPIMVNANMTIIGKSGSGKSYLVKGLIARSVALEIRHVIVDYEGEYRAVTRALGGVTIRISSSSKYKFNPFEIEDEEEMMDDGSYRWTLQVSDKISEMERFVTSMAQMHGNDRISSYESSVINDLLQELYIKDFEFVEGDPESLYQSLQTWQRDARGDRLVNRVKRPQPQFSHFYDKLVKLSETDPQLKELVMRLRRFKAGGTEGMFDTQTVLPETLDGRRLQDAHIIHFDLYDLPEKSSTRLLGMQVVLEWVIEKFIKKDIKTRKRVVIDEAQKMLEREEHGKFIEDVFRRIRKRSGSALAATQDFRKFADNEYGRGIVLNSDTKVLLQQDALDKAAIMSIFGLEEREFDDLVGYTNGKARWVAGQEIFYNQLESFDEEKELLNTRFTKSEAELARERRLG